MPIHIHRVYTRTGDQGETSLVGGQRVPKDSGRIEAYGTTDELGSSLGLARELLALGTPFPDLEDVLGRLQNDLFNAGSELATPPDRWVEGMPSVRESDVRWMEETMDSLGEGLPPLSSFVLAGGGPAGAALHLARTVCRRAERIVVALSRKESFRPLVTIYLNRLSDLLFVLARVVAHRTGHPEVLWREGLESARRARGQAAAGREPHSEVPMSDLVSKKCAPCEGGAPPLAREEVERRLPEIPGWDLREDGKELRRTLRFKNYHEVMAFVNAIAWMAHRENHHPDLEVGFRQVVVRYSTHAIHGVSENDLICAAKANALLA